MENETYNSMPYLSVVMISRNDDYAGGMLPKLQASVNYLLRQLEAKKIESELIIVDWNPPQDKALLREALVLPENLHYSTVKVIEVPSVIHRRYKYWEKRAIHPAVAVNTGFRRARGNFMVYFVGDAFWSEELISFISEHKLERGYLYRCDRVDSIIELSAADKEDYGTILTDLKDKTVIRHKTTNSPDEFEGVKFPQLHTNACGDFQLMHRDHFNMLHGYYETNDVSSIYCDGLLSYAAYSSGIKEKVLPDEMCVYKVVHDNMHCKRLAGEIISIWEKILTPSILPDKAREIIRNYYRDIFGHPRVDYGGIPVPHGNDFFILVKKILTGKRSYIINPETWGLRDEKLDEHIINSAYWEK